MSEEQQPVLSKFHVSILRIKANNNPGINFQVVVEATDYINALEKAKPEIIKELKESGLSVTAPS